LLTPPTATTRSQRRIRPVAREQARQEEFFRQPRRHHTAGGTIADAADSAVAIDKAGNPAAMLRERLARPAQAPQPGWSEHEPVAARRGTPRRKRLAEQLVVGFEIGDADARFGYAGRAAGFGNINRFASEALGNPAPYWPAAQPFVFAMAEPFQIIVAVSFFARIEIQFQVYAFAHTSILHMLWAS